MKIVINNSAWEAMKHDAETRFPNECCGFFYGQYGDEKTVSQVLVINNTKDGDQRRRFEISPEDYLKGERYALKHGLDLLGVYHSHPNHPAVPSEHDRISAVPVFSYIIISVMEGISAEVTSWILNDASRFEKEELNINKK
ncbi:M67 family metallopeptidase [Fulvivirga sp. M361]|uniref:Mov34/MPN/PAD-1 family protein n=1 Tax=Fulvivirga sp. M361 TaxID=2594266 RepID=UPI00117A516D|nr:M67 family metallopeptidase [Fulvivirga sp. M361]TRX59505.1 M67 family metallopeptidase [Fulvivirga sp. M361]